MQLIFLWMNTEKGIVQDLSLPFSPYHSCAYDRGTNTLKRNKAKSNFNIFSKYSPPVSNVSVLVGENGSGKTTIMKEMFELLRKGSNSCQYLALYYEKNREYERDEYYWWSNLWAVGNNSIPFNTEGFENSKFIELKKEEIEDEFFFIRYTDVLSLQEYAKCDLLPTNNSCDLTMAYRLVNPGENRMHYIDGYGQDAILKLYHKETELQIQSMNEKLPFKLSRLDISPCKEIDVHAIELQLLRSNLQWKTIDETSPLNPKGKARELCKEILMKINSWENRSKEDIIVRSIIYTYLRHAINMYGVFNDDEPGTGVPAAIKREVNVPILYWLENLPLDYGVNPCHTIVSFFSKSFESVGVPFGETHFISNLAIFIEWMLKRKRVSYDWDSGTFYTDIDSMPVDGLLEAFQGYKNSIGQYGEAFSFEFEMSSGERAFLNIFSYMKCAKDKLKSADNPKTIRPNSKNKKVARNVLLMWDEMDAFLHPRWQQIEIANVLRCVADMFKEHEIQIVLSTHSPLLLSDVPLPHIIFLKKNNGKVVMVEKQYQTFADNIYRLYEDSFFLNINGKEGNSDSIWIHGKYADEIIERANQIMHKSRIISSTKLSKEMRSEYIGKMMEAYQIIKLIGEPFLRRMMFARWHGIYGMINQNDGDVNGL